MTNFKYVRVNGVLYGIIPSEHTHNIKDVKDFTNDLSKYDNSVAKFVDSDALNKKQNKVLFGTSEPTNDIGEDSDVYFLLEE